MINGILKRTRIIRSDVENTSYNGGDVMPKLIFTEPQKKLMKRERIKQFLKVIGYGIVTLVGGKKLISNMFNVGYLYGVEKMDGTEVAVVEEVKDE